MKILIVAMVNSIHTARWLAQLEGQGWDVHLFPSVLGVASHPLIRNVTIHYPFSSRKISSDGVGRVKIKRRYFDIAVRIFSQRFFPTFQANRLRRVVGRIKPDVVHSLEMQSAGYLTLKAKTASAIFPPWVVTNWGSDIYLFGNLPEHKAEIEQVLHACDFYSCECERDIKLAREFGFQGGTFPVFPNAGGFDLESLCPVRNRVRTSCRKTIVLKGYQNWAGRALVGLRALERCVDLLSGYSVVIYSASADVELAARLFSARTAMPVLFVGNSSTHMDILQMHAQARISIGLSISDAISTSMLEAMVMGAFPIQSCTACADEWVEHGCNGMIVPPEDSDIIELALRNALEDDALVDSAAEKNWDIALSRLDAGALRKKAVDLYSSFSDGNA